MVAFYTKKNMCDQVITDSVSIISNKNYPIYDQNQNCNTQIKVKTGRIIKAHIIDLAIKYKHKTSIVIKSFID
jgi:hypothetical protein